MKFEKASPKDKLFQTAARLFFQHGYRAVGVDTIAAESGIGKMTLYRHFPSKEALIVAYLQESDREFWEYFNQATQAAPSERGKLLAFFEALQAYVTSPDCYGCPFIHIASEYPEPNHPGHQIAIAHKQLVKKRFTELALNAGASQPQELADALLLLMDGAYIAARMVGTSPANPASNVAQTARRLIDSFCKTP